MGLEPEGRWRPDLTHLDAFVAVHEAGGFRKAAERLGLSQPAVSYRIAALEAQLGVELFEKPRRRVILTPEGRSLLRFSARLLDEVAAEGRRISAREGTRDPLVIVCPGAFGRNVVFPALRHPDLQDTRVELLFRSLDEILDMVESGEADLGIAYGLRVTEALQFEPLVQEEFCLVTPAGGAPGKKDGLEDLSRRPFVTYEECSYVFGKWFEDVFGRQPVRLMAASGFSRLEEVLHTVARGVGVSIVPFHAAARWNATSGGASAGLLSIWRPPGRPRCHNQEYAVTRPGSILGPEAERLLSLIRESDPAGEG